ncbi:hypothetical protein [Janthinobacterium sp. 67]|uniref:hypothetical protein n=1 Tax=Janthinobacterium sp. 67 TaxID=2035207 RepID=UPI003FA528F7
MAELRAQGHQRLFLGCSSDPASRSYGFYRARLPAGTAQRRCAHGRALRRRY